MLPDGSGLDFCKKLKSSNAYNDIPIIIVTAKDDEVDKVVGFELGADDYVTKPFSVRELILRIKAILKRNSKHQLNPKGLQENLAKIQKIVRDRAEIILDEQRLTVQ